MDLWGLIVCGLGRERTQQRWNGLGVRCTHSKSDACARMRLSVLALLMLRHLVIVAGVVSPLDKVTQDMKVMKETLDSIQASLITSVSLLQGDFYVIF